MKKLTQTLAAGLLAMALLPQAQAQNDSRVMIQGFNWESSKMAGSGWYNLVASKAGDLQASQIDMIWMPPPSDAASIEGYLPRKLYDLNSRYGTQAQLQQCIGTLHANGLEVIADIVINHRVGVTNWADFQQPAWGCWSVVANDEWGTAGGGNPCGAWDSGDNYGAARDIDHTNSTVQADLSAWMNWLKNTIGFDGWRYDYVRGYSGQYNGIYNNATNPSFSVGELWDNLDLGNPDPHRQQITNWIDQTQGTSTAFDFTTKGVLQQAVNGELWRLNRSGKAPGVIGWWPAKAVTFVDNHDTGSTQAHWPFPGNKVMQGYAYILTHPGIPTVFWDHFYDWGLHDQIKTLIGIRKAQGLHSTSQLSIQVAEANRYAAIIDGKVAMKIGSGNWAPSGSDWVLAASGTDYAVWTKGSVPPPPPASSFTVHFKKPAAWTNATVYFWQVVNGTPTSTATWPGAQMTDEGDGWYAYTVPGDCSNLIFSNSGASQTADLSRCGEGWYDGAWHDTKPTDPVQPPAGGSFVVHFKKPASWSNATVYFWQVVNGTPTSTVAWPGAQMTAEGNGWYAYTIPSDCSNLIFSNNGASQTADLSRCGEGWYNGSWHNQNPDGQAPAGFTVYFKPSGYANPKIYFWAADNGQTTTWPGVAMTNAGNGWYSYTFAGGSCANMIFSNNGSNKTADLNRCGDGWYTNGAWSSTNPNARLAVSVASKGGSEEAYSVGNYPNPFRGSTTISFSMPEQGPVSLTVYSLLGERVATLIDGERGEGSHEVTFRADGLAPGVYLYRLDANGTSVIKRMAIR